MLEAYEGQSKHIMAASRLISSCPNVTNLLINRGWPCSLPVLYALFCGVAGPLSGPVSAVSAVSAEVTSVVSCVMFASQTDAGVCGPSCIHLADAISAVFDSNPKIFDTLTTRYRQSSHGMTGRSPNPTRKHRLAISERWMEDRRIFHTRDQKKDGVNLLVCRFVFCQISQEYIFLS